LISVTSLLLAACGKIDININRHTILPPFINPFNVGTSAELVSGSTEESLTPINQYHVNVTAGTMIKDVQSKTVNGYIVYYGLDGELVPVE
jgi:hypothetical protein